MGLENKMKALQLKQKRIKLLDTGQRNEGFALRVSYPEKDYKPKKQAPFDKKLYSREYYKRPEVVARRKTAQAKARKAAYDELHSKRPGYKERKRELQRHSRQKKKLKNEKSNKNRRRTNN